MVFFSPVSPATHPLHRLAVQDGRNFPVSSRDSTIQGLNRSRPLSVAFVGAYANSDRLRAIAVSTFPSCSHGEPLALSSPLRVSRAFAAAVRSASASPTRESHVPTHAPLSLRGPSETSLSDFRCPRLTVPCPHPRRHSSLSASYPSANFTFGSSASALGQSIQPTNLSPSRLRPHPLASLLSFLSRSTPHRTGLSPVVGLYEVCLYRLPRQ